MKRTRTLIAVGVLAACIGPLAGTAVAHNAACVPTGSGAIVFAGSNRDAPVVSESNPNVLWDSVLGAWVLDLQTGSGDQYGARYAADQGDSHLERPTICSPEGPRAD